MWHRAKTDTEVLLSEWLPEWNLPPAERHDSRPFCSVHWLNDARMELLLGDKVFKRETRSDWQRSVIYLLERNGKVVTHSEQILRKTIQ